MFPFALDIGRIALLAVALGLLVWFLWAMWRIVSLYRSRALRADAQLSDRESFGFAGAS